MSNSVVQRSVPTNLKIGLQTWGSEGDTQPFIALAAQLAQNGHEVTLVVTDVTGRDHGVAAQKLGFQLVNVPAPQELPTQLLRELFHSRNPVRQLDLILSHAFYPVLEPMFAAATALCAACDAVVGHFVLYPLRIAAEKHGVPLGLVQLAHNGQASSEMPPPGFPALGGWANRMGWRLARLALNRLLLARINALRLREGLSPQHDVLEQTWTSERLNLLAVSPQLCRTPRDWGARYSVCGFLNLPAPLTTDEITPGLLQFIAAGAPPVYFTFGSLLHPDPDYVAEVVELWAGAVQRMGCRAIFQLPVEDLSGLAFPSGVLVLRRAPHAMIFPLCALIVHHGGAGTTQSSLLAGRPSVVVAHFADQSFWGSELQRVGVAGRTLARRSVSASRLARSIAQVLTSPGMPRRASEIGAAMARENGAETAAKLIEARLR
jgi:sterol 3beta-glucosyltransferase/vancomycin aglycone glucosyltransferase